MKNRNQLLLTAKILIMIGALFPICIGLYYYIFFLNSAGINSVEHIAFTNLISTGISIFVIALTLNIDDFAWKFGLLGFLIIWSGGNDSYILLKSHLYNQSIFPIAIIPFSLGSIGLFILSILMKNQK